MGVGVGRIRAARRPYPDPGLYAPARVPRFPAPLAPTCYDGPVTNRTEPKTVGQWIRYVIVAVIALFLVWWMLRVYVF